MADHLTTKQTVPGRPGTATVPLGPWVRANAFGIGTAFGLFALVGGVLEAMGADHHSLVRDVPAVLALAAGGVLFALLRRRALGALHTGSRWQLLLVGICLPVGLFVGLGTPPFDWIGAVLVAGTVGGALQLRALRPVTPGSLLVSAGSWLAAGLALAATGFLVIDGLIIGVLGLDSELLDTVAGFVVALGTLGIVGGAIGGAIEGTILRLRLGRAN